MKTSFVRRSTALLMAVFVVISVASAKDGPATAKITRVNGNAQYSTDNGSTWHTLTKGMVVNPGVIIRTETAAYVDVLLGAPALASGADPVPGSLVYFPGSGGEQSNIIRVNGNTVISIDRLTENRTGADVVSDTQLDLRKGSIYFSVKKVSAASQFRVKYPTGIAGVRGSFGRLDDTGVLRMLLGAAYEAYVRADGSVKTQFIQALQMWDPNTELITQLTVEFRTAIQEALRDMLISIAGGNPPSTYLLLLPDLTGMSGSEFGTDQGGGQPGD